MNNTHLENLNKHGIHCVDKLMTHVDQHQFPLLFATISGSHLYGFPSPDSDFDLRGAHVLPLKQVIGLAAGKETVEKEGFYDGLEIDLVTYDVSKFFALLLKKNGNVLEQVFSPLVVYSTPEHEELKSIATGCITKHHCHHYLGIGNNQWQLFRKEDPPRVKPLLYVFRVLLTGIHLMKTGTVEANLLTLNEDSKLSYLDELVERKLSGPEKGNLPAADLQFFEREFERLIDVLKMESDRSSLPERPQTMDQLNDLLVRIRMATANANA